VKCKEIFAGYRAADHFVDQVDRTGMPVNILMIPQWLAANGESEFQNFDGFAKSQSVALDGCGLVCPLRSEALEELIADICRKTLVKKPSLSVRCRSAFQKGKNRIVADIQFVPAIDFLRCATKADTGSEDFPQLGFVRFQLGLKRFARDGAKLVTRLNLRSADCNDKKFFLTKIVVTELSWERQRPRWLLTPFFFR